MRQDPKGEKGSEGQDSLEESKQSEQECEWWNVPSTSRVEDLFGEGVGGNSEKGSERETVGEPQMLSWDFYPSLSVRR